VPGITLSGTNIEEIHDEPDQAGFHPVCTSQLTTMSRKVTDENDGEPDGEQDEREPEDIYHGAGNI
jgi:hypothetical protein